MLLKDRRGIRSIIFVVTNNHIYLEINQLILHFINLINVFDRRIYIYIQASIYIEIII